MNPKPLSSLNHFTVPVAMFLPPRRLVLSNAEDAEGNQLRRALLIRALESRSNARQGSTQ
jgi:hypothetical protein